jgi:(1->4)-alpha-D-glucan 1-alpha-D-glucosylmutase
MTTSGQRRYGRPGASYRLQLHRDFGFEQATAVVPYLRALGITHLYLSPIFEAAPGSRHGYDVFDHGKVNPELGGLGGLYALGEELVANDMGLILDIVPNHVGIAGGANPWWRDVLRNGQASRYAQYFDIDWDAQPQMATGVLVLPVLGDSFGVALEAGQLTLALDDDAIVVCYYDNRLPLRPESYPRVVGLPPLGLGESLNDPASLAALAGALEDLASQELSRRDGATAQFHAVLRDEPAVRTFVEDALRTMNGTPGEPASFDRLEEVLRAQHYRLADWRLAGAELNYRRFFDQNSLAAIRVERDDVFEETHRLLFDLVARGIVTAVRVDHVDGLYDPAAYLAKLAGRLDEAAEQAGGGVVPVFVEKILQHGEQLPAWPVDGTTGYDTLAEIGNWFIDRTAEVPMTRTYEGFIESRARFDFMRYEARMEVAESAFAGEISVLAYQLHRIAQRQRLYRDIPLRTLRAAIHTTAAAFPVYRTYVAPDGPPDDVLYVSRALEEAHRRDPGLSETALTFLREVLLVEPDVDPEEYASRLHFRRRFQQITSPIMAKGIEDTTFFRYNRMLALNEVGSDPGRFGAPRAELHAFFEQQAATWRGAMNASSTHDTKRSEDTRARLQVLTEMPREWAREVSTWARLNERHKRSVDGELAPHRNFEYYLYQTLVASIGVTGVNAALRGRLHEHATKAMREAKEQTSWVGPNHLYEVATHEFLDRILNRSLAAAFLRRVDRLAAAIEPAAALNGLNALVIKSLAPGFPDFYQGTELFNYRLTDPDNRAPVDFAARTGMLAHLPGAPPAEVYSHDCWKLWLTQRLLDVRAKYPQQVAGSYHAVAVDGPRERNLLAFTRGNDGGLAVVVSRFTRALMDDGGCIHPDTWAGTTIALPGKGRWRNLLDGRDLGAGHAEAADVLGRLPFAVLVRE